MAVRSSQQLRISFSSATKVEIVTLRISDLLLLSLSDLDSVGEANLWKIIVFYLFIITPPSVLHVPSFYA